MISSILLISSLLSTENVHYAVNCGGHSLQDDIGIKYTADLTD